MQHEQAVNVDQEVSKMSVEEINQLNPNLVSFYRGKKVAPEKTEPPGLEGKR